MPKHITDVLQWNAGSNQVSGKAVPEQMGSVSWGLQTGQLDMSIDHVSDVVSIQWSPGRTSEKENIAVL